MSRLGIRPGPLVCALGLLVVLALASEAQARGTPLIAAAGDIACGPNNPRFNSGFGTSNSCQELLTSNLLVGRSLSAVLALGDLQYDDNGSLDSFLDSYQPTWGRWHAASHPVIGNHEYDDGQGAQGYWDYWDGVGVGDGAAGVRGHGWYSYNLGSWHLVALNSNCDEVSCRGSSRQLRWLRQDLREHPRRCVLAYMHHPRFSSGVYEEPGDTRALWNALYRGGADVVLNGHEHIYERFAPQRPSGVVDHKRGISQFTVGTGGYFLFPIDSPRVPHSQFAYNQDFGVLFMSLGFKRYGWSFVDVFGHTIDHGTRRCHRERDGRATAVIIDTGMATAGLTTEAVSGPPTPRAAGLVRLPPAFNPRRFDAVQDRGLAAYIAELVGTLFLVFFITSAVTLFVATGNQAQFGSDFAVIGLVHAFLLFGLILIFGPVSGGHFNPAVTVAVAAIRRIDPIDAVIYILAQLSGAVLGALLTKALLVDEGRAGHYGAVQVSSLLGSKLQGFVVEGIGALVLVLAVLVVALGTRSAKEWAPLGIGATLGFAVMVTGPLTGGSLNPARWFGPALVSNTWGGVWPYVLGPLVAALIGAVLFRFVIEAGEKVSPPIPGQGGRQGPNT